MSDNIVKIVPKDPFCIISKSALHKAVVFLNANIYCDSIKFECNTTPKFVDCGSNLESITYPNCGEMLSFDWWSEAMSKAAENAFTVLETELPCCGKVISLNDLEYYFPCGFACCMIDLLNPSCDIGEGTLDTIQNLLGVNVRIIQAHI